MSENEKFITPAEVEGMTPEEKEAYWFRNYYKGDDMKQLTLRAVLMGSALGSFMSLSNLYIGLKTGWGLGVAITASILSYTIWTTLHKAGIVKTKMTILENNCMQSTASASGYSTGGTLVSAIAAYMMVTNQTLPTGVLMAWVFFLAVLGVTMAIPMKRQMINVEQLKFPSGIAAAETLKALHAESGSGVKAAKALGVAGVFGSAVAVLRDGFELIPSYFNVFGEKMADLTIRMEVSPMMIAAGAIMGLKVCVSILIGAILNYFILAPWMYNMGYITSVGYDGIVKWSLWGGAACMVTSALFSFAFQWKTVLRAVGGISALWGKKKAMNAEQTAMAKIEGPVSWFVFGVAFGSLGVLYMLDKYFHTPYWMGALAVVMSFFLALVACRVAGETDTTPVGAMGKITQLFYGAITPKNAPSSSNAVNPGVATNLMTACVTAGVADSASDLLYDLKSGYLLGANPKRQFLAQFSGIFAGTVVSVLSFQFVVNSASALGSDRFPAPEAQTWAGVARLLEMGIGSLDSSKRWAILIGGIVGILLPLLERVLPQKAGKWVPNAMGIGLAFTIPFWNGLSFFIGGLIGHIIEVKKPKIAEDFTIPVASGVVAGESMTGVAIVMYQNGVFALINNLLYPMRVWVMHLFGR